MLRLIKPCLTGIALLTLILNASSANAKPTPPEPQGIHASGIVMHPGANLAVAYDSLSNQNINDGRVDIGLSFKSRLEDETTKSWDTDALLSWRQYWGIGNADANGGVNVKLATHADLFKQSIFRLTPSFSYQYLDQPEDDNLRQDFQNHTVRLGVGATIQPGQGAVFSQRFSYNMGGRIYPDHSDISYFTHRIESVTRWNFLPNSSMTLHVNFTPSHFIEDTRNSSQGADLVNQSPNAIGMPVRVKYSLQGLLLPRMSYVLGLGYGYAYYSKENNEHLFIMNAKLGYSFRDNIELYAEYRKDFDTALYGDYYKFHRASLAFDAVWFEHLQTKADVGFGAFDFSSNAGLIRTDKLLSVKAHIAYYIIPSVKLALEYNFGYNTSDIKEACYTKHAAIFQFAYEY